MSEGINLLDPNKQSEASLAIKRMNKMRVIAVSMLFIISSASIIMFILVAISPLPELQRKEQSLRLTLSESKNAIAQHALVNERTEVISKILNSRGSLAKLLSLIQTNLPEDTEVQAINADNNVVTITIESASLNSIDSFIKGMKDLVENQEGFSQITLSNLLSDDTKNTYNVTLTLTAKK